MARAREPETPAHVVLEGERIRLRLEEDADREVTKRLRRLLPEGPTCDHSQPFVVERDGQVAGLVEYAPGEPETGWATFGAIVMAKGERGWGYGSEAIQLIESHLGAATEARSFRAAVSKEMGLAFYFWLRQGYHPAGPEETFWPCAGGDDIIWMVRRGV